MCTALVVRIPHSLRETTGLVSVLVFQDSKAIITAKKKLPRLHWRLNPHPKPCFQVNWNPPNFLFLPIEDCPLGAPLRCHRSFSSNWELGLCRPYTNLFRNIIRGGDDTLPFSFTCRGRVITPLFLPLEGSGKSSNYHHHPRFFAYRLGYNWAAELEEGKKRLILWMK